VELGFLLGPDLLHRQHPLPEHLPAPARVGAVVSHLLAVPTPADAEQEAGAGKVIQASDHVGEDDRVPLNNQTDSGRQLEPGGCHRGRRQGHERVDHMPVLLR
jgi:hypothetical protein